METTGRQSPMGLYTCFENTLPRHMEGPVTSVQPGRPSGSKLSRMCTCLQTQDSCIGGQEACMRDAPCSETATRYSESMPPCTLFRFMKSYGSDDRSR